MSLKKTFKFQRTVSTTAEHCCVPLCQASSKYNKVLSFHTFPSNEETRRKWIAAIRRESLPVRPHTRVCSRHFKQEDVREPESDRGRRLLKKGAVPTLFEWNNYSAPPLWERTERPTEDNTHSQEEAQPVFTEHDYASAPDPAVVDRVREENAALREEVLRLRKQVEELTLKQRFGLRRFAASEKNKRFFRRYEWFPVSTGKSRLPRRMKSNERNSDTLEPSESSGSPQSPSGSLHSITPDRQVRPEVYHCSHCGKCFNKKTNLKQHQRIHTGEKPYPCSYCGVRFTQRGNLQQHQRIHKGEKLYHCSQCGKNFTQKGHLQRHQRIHTGEKPYQCSQCGRSFAENNKLLKHQRVHSGVKPYRCSDCGMRFTERTNLQVHLLIHTGDKPFYCLECGKSYTQKTALRVHQRIHTGHKPYYCSQCGKSFTTHGSFQQHQRVHTGEKPYHCSQCGRRFSNQSNLRRHQRIHTGEKSHRCSECEKSFSNQSNLQRHKHVHRAEDVPPFS